MASGKNHDKGIIYQSPVLFIGTALWTRDIVFSSVVTSASLFGGLFLSPDLDVPSRPYYRWSFLRWLWVPYMRLIPRHRHFTSHGLFIGSALRLLYFLSLIVGMLLLLSTSKIFSPRITEFFDSLLIWIKQPSSARLLIAVFLGVEASAINHYMLDNLWGLLPKSVYEKLKK